MDVDRIYHRAAATVSKSVQAITAFSNLDGAKDIAQIATMLYHCIKSGGKIIACGNGGSNTQAMHLAEELTGRFKETRRPLPAMAVSDPSYITCVANDFGYDIVFARYIEAFAKPEDCVVLFSTSGNSPNIVAAAKQAIKNDATVIGILGNRGGDVLKYVDRSVIAPDVATDSSQIQEVHLVVLHSIVDVLEQMLFSHLQ